jgi:predicted glutamine amidotransferase
MCRWLVYKGESILMDQLLLKPKNSLIHQSIDCQEGAVTVNGDGFGIGWYSDNIASAGLYKDQLPAWNDNNLNSLVTHIQSPLFFAHIRATTGSPSSRVNCHPFRYKNWLFMHNGSIAEFITLRYHLEKLITPKYYSLRQGGTDTEALFLIALSFGLEKDPVAALEKTLQAVRKIMKEHNVTGPLRASIAVSNGNDVYVLRYSNTESCPSLYYSTDVDKINLIENFSINPQVTPSVLVVSEPLDSSLHEHYKKIENGELLHITPNVKMHRHTLTI